ncbi:MAG: type VI secretion system baseplate subunit TssK [Azoarcus sp.]|jgi:type VI secretion system protein ImpJ|nr:type VI secretion system baseplate subunit TssK [Azoarcus sp.]
MGYINKVVWSEGMFLRPQHFQQQERYFESFIRRGQGAFEGFFWGFSVLEIDPDALGLGTILIRRARGLLPDGTPFDLAADGGGPLAFDFPPHAKNATVCLVLPALREGVESVIYDEDGASAARFRASTFEAADANALGAGAAEIQIARPRFRLMLEADVPHGWIAMKMLHVTERQADNALRVDREFIPPTLNCRTQESLSGFIRETASLLGQRGEALAGRLSASGRGGISEVGEFLILMLINRWLPLIVHLGQIDVLHPERLYAQLVGLAGELISFSSETRRATGYPAYVHDDLQTSFRPLLLDLRRALATVLDQTVIRIELQERRFGIKLANVADRALFKQASFVLAAHADLPVEQMQAQFPAQVKIGPVEKIRDLINLQLPGIVLRPLPVAPRELPFHAGYNYFELDTRHELWKELEKSAGMALHVAGDFPGLGLECWAIRK